MKDGLSLKAIILPWALVAACLWRLIAFSNEYVRQAERFDAALKLQGERFDAALKVMERVATQAAIDHDSILNTNGRVNGLTDRVGRLEGKVFGFASGFDEFTGDIAVDGREKGGQ